MSFKVKKLEGFKRKKNNTALTKEEKRELHDSAKLFLEKNHVYITKDIKKRTYIYLENVKELKPPVKNEQLRIRTQQRFNLLVILLILIENHKFVEEITIASYTFNQEAFDILIQMIENNKLGRLNLLLAPFFKIRQEKYYNKLKEVCLKTKNVYLTFAHSHLKITLIRAGNDFFQMEGSMNYSGNQMAEQLVIENNRSTYDEDYNFLLNILAQRKNKTLEFIC